MPQPDCVFCDETSTRVGEHVIPSWLLHLFEPDTFTTTLNGVHDPREIDTLMRWKLAACQTCNGWLARKYEERAKLIVPRLLGRPPASHRVVLDAGETHALAEWAVKTLLLTRHPQTRRRHAGKTLPPSKDPWPVGKDLMRAWRASGDLPAGLRLWIARSHDEHGRTEMPPDYARILLPAASRATFLALGTGDGGALRLCLSWRGPDRRRHPMTSTGAARELWPRVPDTFVFEDLPLLTATGAAQFDRGFVADDTGHVGAAPTTLMNRNSILVGSHRSRHADRV